MDKKKRLITMVVTLLVLTIGVTFAYFMARTGEGKQAGTTITTGIVDDLKFNVSKENLSLNINQFNFASGAGNLTDNVTATASLKANSTKNTATYNYYVYFQIESNDYVYTTTDKKPEIVLSITGPNGEITSVDGLKYVSATNADGTIVKGFDITTLGKSITKIANAYEISSSSSTNYTNQEWTFTVTFINLDTNQVGNQNKNLTGKVLIQQDKIVDSISVVAKSGDALATTLESLGTKGDSSLTGLYYHDSSLTNGAGDNSYRFAGASDQVNNYVCFGSNVTPCPTDNLYRIIGVFGDKVKLIKSDYATTTLLGADGDYSKMYTANNWDNSAYKGNNLANVAAYNWNKSNQNTWSLSNLNKTNLNKNFITNIGADWAAKIAETTWKVGGNTYANIGTQPAKTAYQNEINNPVTTNSQDNATELKAKIGLMYVSDYMYAAPQDKWTLVGYNSSDASKDYRAATSVNWMYMGLAEWTISRNAVGSGPAFFVNSSGYVNDNIVGFIACGVRPVFNLSSSVNYASGSGTAADPILVS